MNDNTLQSVAESFADSFIAKQRDNGNTFYCLTDTAPEWMREAVQAAHGDMLPDDWRYAMIRSAAQTLFEYEPDEWRDLDTEIADNLVDVYTSSLTAWLASHNARVAYCDQASEEYGPADNMEQSMQRGQFCELLEIVRSLIESFESQA